MTAGNAGGRAAKRAAWVGCALAGVGAAASLSMACGGAPSKAAWRGEPGTLPYFADASFTPHWDESHADVPDDFHSVGPFSLVDQTGAFVTEETLRGKVYVANFFFATCPGICPTTMASMARLQSELGAFDDVALVSHSVTPEADSVPALQAYAERMGVVSSRWRLLTGSRRGIYDLGRRAYFVGEGLVSCPGNSYT